MYVCACPLLSPRSDQLSHSAHFCLFWVIHYSRWHLSKHMQLHQCLSVCWIAVDLAHSWSVCEHNIPPNDKGNANMPTFLFLSLPPRLSVFRPGLPGWVLWCTNGPVCVSERVSELFMRAVCARLLQLPTVPMWVLANSNLTKLQNPPWVLPNHELCRAATITVSCSFTALIKDNLNFVFTLFTFLTHILGRIAFYLSVHIIQCSNLIGWYYQFDWASGMTFHSACLYRL